jgi:hypothetical protein
LSGQGGSQVLNKPWKNVVNWALIIALFIMSGLLAAQVLLPGYFPTSAVQVLKSRDRSNEDVESNLA